MESAFQYFNKCRKEIAKISKVSHCSQFHHWADYVGCVVRHGAHIRQYTLGDFWRFSNAERKSRMTFRRMCKLMDRLDSKEHISILKNKSEFNRHFKDFIKRDWINLSETDFEGFLQFVQKHNTVIFKPVGGIMGRGITKFTLGEPYDKKELEDLYNEWVKTGALVEECIVPHPQMVFNNTSVNTIRSYTVFGKDKKGHVLKTILRAGVGDTAADNYALGGSIYEVDAVTGIVSSLGQSKHGDSHIKHPGSDIIMLGYQIPRWDEVLELSVKAAELLPQIPIVGWDIAIMPDGVQLIEGNHNPDYELLEYLGTTGYYQKIKELI